MRRSVSLAAALLGGAVVLASCAAGHTAGPADITSSPSSPTTASTTEPGASPGPRFGFSFSPRTFDAADFEPFFRTAGPVADVITWAGDWFELGDPGGGPEVITHLGEEYGYEPVMIVGFFDQEERVLLRPFDDATLDEYVRLAVDYARRYRPGFFGIGVEVDILYETSPDDFVRFVDLFARTVDAIHEVSPGTKVFTAFQLERLRGLRGGLFGGENDLEQATWELIELFPTADLVAFTTYPGLVFPTPGQIPDDYYREILRHTDKPLGFVEAGWPAGSVAPGWDGSEEEQAAFVERFAAAAADLDVELAVWSFLYDVPASPGFDTMGLIPTDGPPRAAWDTWQQVVSP